MEEYLITIDRFIKERIYNYAILINGKWGSGKTFFVIEKLMPHLKASQFDVFYFSLYGISTIDDISQALSIQLLKGIAPKEFQNALDTKSGQVVTTLVSSVLKHGMDRIGITSLKNDIKRIGNAIADFDKKVIIFDDLERCGCPVNEVLGYINNFVEHSKASIIIIANEDEIGRLESDKNIELKNLVSMDPRINIKMPSTREEQLFDDPQDQGNKTSFSIEEINYRREKIFPNNNHLYRAIKEKVIGLTIDYRPDLKSAFKVLIEKDLIRYNRPLLYNKLFALIDWFVEIAERNQHANLRTFQYFIEKICIIYDAIGENYSEYDENIIDSIIKYSYRSCIRYMKGLDMPIWEGDYGYQNFDSEHPFSGDYEFGFKFIDELVINNTIVEASVVDTLNRLSDIYKKKGQLEGDPYQKIKNWFISEDDQLSSWLEDIENKIKNGVYSIELYSELLSYIVKIKDNNVMPHCCENIYNAMVDYITSCDLSKIVELESMHFIVDNDSQKRELQNKYNNLSAIIDKRKSIIERTEFEKAIEQKDGWATNLCKIIKNKRRMLEHSFLYWIEIEKIIELIKDSKNYELSEFRNALQLYFKNDTFYVTSDDDIDALRELRNEMEKLDESGLGDVKKAYKRWIIGDIDRYLQSTGYIE